MLDNPCSALYLNKPEQINLVEIKSTILNSKIDKISQLFQKLYSQGIVSNLVLIKKKIK